MHACAMDVDIDSDDEWIAPAMHPPRGHGAILEDDDANDSGSDDDGDDGDDGEDDDDGASEAEEEGENDGGGGRRRNDALRQLDNALMEPDRLGIDIRDDTTARIQTALTPEELSAERCPICRIPPEKTEAREIEGIMDSALTYGLETCARRILEVYQTRVMVPLSWETAHHGGAAGHFVAEKVTPICKDVVLAHMKEHCLNHAIIDRQSIKYLVGLRDRLGQSCVMPNGRTIDLKTSEALIKTIEALQRLQKGVRTHGGRIVRTTRAAVKNEK